MPRYANGRAPLADLVYLGPQQYLPAGCAARWREMQRLAWEKYRVWLVITPGWNGYRPLNIQIEYREELGIWAAVPGYSSHGLVYQGRDCAAIDVYNWRDLAPGNESLAWSRFVALCRLVGFTVDFVSPQELWHIGDFDPYTEPAFASITINLLTTAQSPQQSEEDDMLTVIWNGHWFTFGPQQVLYHDSMDTAQASAFMNNRDRTVLGLDNNGMTAICQNRGVPWSAVDACMQRKAYGIDGSVGGAFWSRAIEQKIDVANLGRDLASSFDELKARAAAVPALLPTA